MPDNREVTCRKLQNEGDQLIGRLRVAADDKIIDGPEGIKRARDGRGTKRNGEQQQMPRVHQD